MGYIGIIAFDSKNIGQGFGHAMIVINDQDV
jgi:hypothetical protein